MVWQYISMIHDCEETPFEDESIKRAVLKRLYNVRADLADFVAKRLEEGGFDDITDNEGRINLLKFIRRLDDTYDIAISFELMRDLKNVDSRFLIKASDTESDCGMDDDSRVDCPREDYFITLTSVTIPDSVTQIGDSAFFL